MRSPVKFISIYLTIAFALSAAAQAPKLQSNKSGNATAMPPMMQMPLVAPLFVEGGQFASTLVLVNGSRLNTYADVMVRGLDGKEIASQRVTFTSHSQRRVAIGSLLEAAGSPATTGSIVIMQSPSLKGPAIAAQLSITYRGSADPNYIGEEVSMLDMKGSQVLRGVADRMHGSPLLAITSMNEATQHLNIECLGEHGSIAARRVELAAAETLVTDACADADTPEADFGTVLGRISEDAHGPVGIALTSDAVPGSFAAFALAPHGKNGQRFFSVVSFTAPKMFYGRTGGSGGSAP